MSRTAYGNLTGHAAAAELRDQRDYITMAQDRERTRILTEQKKNECAALYAEASYLYGKDFEDWYDSDAVPQFGPASERIELINQWIAQNGAGVLQTRRAAIMQAFQNQVLKPAQVIQLTEELAEIEVAIHKTGESS